MVRRIRKRSVLALARSARGRRAHLTKDTSRLLLSLEGVAGYDRVVDQLESTALPISAIFDVRAAGSEVADRASGPLSSAVRFVRVSYVWLQTRVASDASPRPARTHCEYYMYMYVYGNFGVKCLGHMGSVAIERNAMRQYTPFRFVLPKLIRLRIADNRMPLRS